MRKAFSNDVQPPEPRLITSFGSFATEVPLSYSAVVLKHWFNHMLEIVVPVVKEEMSPILSDSNEFFYQICTGLENLLQPKFLQTYIKTGNFYGLSIGSKIDCANVVAIYSGKLLLSLDKNTYEQLGLVGIPSKFSKKGKQQIFGNY